MNFLANLITIIGLLGTIPNLHGQSVSFDTQALKTYTKCEQCSKNDCLFYHEARDKCQSVCQDRFANGDPQNPQPGGSGHGGGGGGTGAGLGCFSGTDIVISNYGPMKMADLVGLKNVQVLSRNHENQLEFSTVYSWMHADASLEFEFIIFTTESGQKLSITSSHLIYETDCSGGNRKIIFAKKVELGKCLYVNENGALKESKVVGKREEMKMGIFAPITYNGNILVNDVLASCFTNYENEFLQKFLHSTFDMFRRFLPTSLIEFAYSTPLGAAMIDVPQSIFSFVDLSKSFTKQI